MKYRGRRYEFPSIRTMTPRRDAELASTIWSEGRESLKELLKYCINNRICTLACCAGHDEREEDEGYSNGYISFILNNRKTANAMVPLLSVATSTLGVDAIAFSTYKENGTIDCQIRIREYMENHVFDTILKTLKRIRDGEKLEIDPMVQSMYDTITGIDRRTVEDFSVEYRFFLTRGGVFEIKAPNRCTKRDYLSPDELIELMGEVQQDGDIFKGRKRNLLDNIYQFCLDRRTITLNRLQDLRWAKKKEKSPIQNEY